MAAPQLSHREVRAFLESRHAGPIEDLEPLEGGFWSTAYGYRAQGRPLVVRFGSTRDWFEADRRAMAFAGPDLPVPVVEEIGEAFAGAYAISRRHHGVHLETIPEEAAPVAGPMLGRLLNALRQVPGRPDTPVDWGAGAPTPGLTWRDWILAGLVDDPSRTARGWRPRLAADPRLDRLFRAGEARVRSVVEACPERRDLVHGDLLHANVLVSEDASRVTGVFSWKCSVRGDFLYDTAWCTFWAPWHPGIEAADAWGRTLAAVAGDPARPADAAIRHHCYELQIGLVHLGWTAWVGDEAELAAVAERTETVLERGPVTTGTGVTT